MTDREKLIELLRKTEIANINGHKALAEVCFMSHVFGSMADHLLANGVTVQRWIPVTERLPEVGRSVIAYNAPAKCAAEAVYKGEGKFLQFRWAARLQEQEITHWRPLPKPPKEAE